MPSHKALFDKAPDRFLESGETWRERPDFPGRLAQDRALGQISDLKSLISKPQSG
jgi:hypothetical protein